MTGSVIEIHPIDSVLRYLKFRGDVIRRHGPLYNSADFVVVKMLVLGVTLLGRALAGLSLLELDPLSGRASPRFVPACVARARACVCVCAHAKAYVCAHL